MAEKTRWLLFGATLLLSAIVMAALRLSGVISLSWITIASPIWGGIAFLAVGYLYASALFGVNPYIRRDNK